MSGRPCHAGHFGLCPGRLVVVAAALASFSWAAAAGDWPTYMHDNARSGVTAEPLKLPMQEQWVYRAPGPIRPDWPDPQPDFNELPKVKFDDALYAVSDGSNVYFGSSIDDQVYALDAASGAVRWRFFTGGPVRLAPTVDRGRVYVGSDDGSAYCLAADSGRLLWEYGTTSGPRRVIGNGRVISLWPIRTGVMIDGRRAYFGSGIFPYHGAAIIALDAETGRPVPWKDHSPKVWQDLSPQGYLLRCSRGLVVPYGRCSPVVMDAESGNPVHRLTAKQSRTGGGTYAVVVGREIHTGTQNTLYAYDAETGEALSQWTPVRQLVATPELYFTRLGKPLPNYQPAASDAERDRITAVDRAIRDAAPRKDESVKKASTRWVYSHPNLVAMILAGDRIVAGCKGEVALVDARDGRELWAAKVEGEAVGLAVAGGRLIVSTTAGAIYCFAATPPPARIAARVAAEPWPAEPPAAVIEQAAEGVVRESGVRRGYALVTGAGAVRLACELAKRTELIITGVESDPAQLQAARRRLDAAGLYGQRVTVQAGRPDCWPYPDYAANLAVHVDSPGEPPAPARELLRVVKPCGGVLMVGSLDAAPGAGTADAPAARLWDAAGVVTRAAPVLRSAAPWTRMVRGVLEGSGWWTHCYADAGNTGASSDSRVKGPLELLWFGAPGGDEAPDRHQRNVSPLVVNGRVFCQGWRGEGRENTIVSFDAYNGVRYWEREVPGAIRFGLPAVSGNLACSTDSLFVATGAACLRLDALTGETTSRYETPPAANGTRPTWGHVAVANGILYGSTKIPEAPMKPVHWTVRLYGPTPTNRFSDAVFAFDIASGKQLWVYRGKEIRDSTIAIADSRVFFVEDRGQTAPASPAVARTNGTDTTVDRLGQVVQRPGGAPLVRTVVALDAATGHPAWEREQDLTDCGFWGRDPDPRQAPGFAELQALCKDGALVLAASYHRHDKPPENAVMRRAVALSTRDGRVLWSEPVGNLNRPMIIRDKLLAGPYLRSLHTGQVLQQPDPRTGKDAPWAIAKGYGGACGTPSACDAYVFFRGGWRSVAGGTDVSFLEVRAGCFINIIPAGGVVVQPEAGSGCTCMQAMQCTIAFRPRETD